MIFEKEQISSKGVFFSLRLLPGQDLITELRDFCKKIDLQAGFIAGVVGSLSEVVIRFAGQPNGTKIAGCFEVVSLIGTLDELSEHLHIGISDEKGKMIGGHVMAGCIVRTTMELVICVLPDLKYSRSHCKYSGYDELKIESAKDK